MIQAGNLNLHRIVKALKFGLKWDVKKAIHVILDEYANVDEFTELWNKLTEENIDEMEREYYEELQKHRRDACERFIYELSDQSILDYDRKGDGIEAMEVFIGNNF